MRPTAVVYWLCIGLYFSAEAYVKSRNMVPWGLLRSATAVGLGAGAALLAGDALFYGRMTCPPYNFVKFNLLTVSLTAFILFYFFRSSESQMYISGLSRGTRPDVSSHPCVLLL